MASSAASRAATRACGTPSTTKAATGKGVDARRPGPSRRTPGIDAETVFEAERPSTVVLDDRRPTELLERFDGGVEGHRADDVRGARLLAVGRIGPDDLVEVHQVDGTPTGEERIALGEGAFSDR